MTSTLSGNITRLRKEFGDDLAIIAHHYQMDDVVKHADHRGDSLALAQIVSGLKARKLVFCGVFFMAESAALLARPDQKVYIPDPSAECVMASMASADLLEEVLEKLSKDGRKIIPVTYVNSTLAVKSVVGARGGSVCTSSNAEKILAWALNEGDAVLFVPDMNLGANTALKLGIEKDDMHILKVKKSAEEIDMTAAQKAKVLLWPGFCPIHVKFETKDIDSLKSAHPEALIAVHPESTPELVAKSDLAGSTSALINYVKEAPEGSVLGIGTEINLVARLSKEYAGVKKVIPLVESECADMIQTTEEKLLACLESIKAGEDKLQAKIREDKSEDAKSSLELMLEICA